MKTLLTSIVSWSAIAIVAALMLGYSGGCQSTGANPDVQQVVVDADQTVANLQAAVDKAQAVVDGLNAKIAKLPVDDPIRKSLEKQLPQAQRIVTEAQIVLDLAQIVTSAAKATPLATQPVSPPAK